MKELSFDISKAQSRLMKDERKLVDDCCSGFSITKEDFYSRDRKSNNNKARKVFCWVMFYDFGYNNTEIARCLNLDHTTVLHHKKTMFKMMDKSPSFRKKVSRIRGIEVVPEAPLDAHKRIMESLVLSYGNIINLNQTSIKLKKLVEEWQA